MYVHVYGVYGVCGAYVSGVCMCEVGVVVAVCFLTIYTARTYNSYTC